MRRRRNPTLRTAAPLAATGAASVLLARSGGFWLGLGASAILYALGKRDYAATALGGAALGGLLSSSISGGAGAFSGPVVPNGSVLSSYGRRSTGAGTSRPHLGIDLRAPEGTPIYAAHSGTVSGVYPDGRLGGYGNTVVIDHVDEPMAALYSHMSEIDPSMVRGARVEAGQRIGAVGHTNSAGGFESSADHTHMEIFLVTNGDRVRSFTHFQGGENYFPDRMDPAVWAAERGVRLV